MKTFYFLVLLTAFLGSGQYTTAQDKYEENAATGVIIHADPRLAILTKKHTNVKLGVIRSGRGFRVQIYNGNDRVRANKLKVDFMRRFPGVRAYMTYVQPQFRVKVGDFRSKGEAQRMYEQVNSLYTPVMIVPDIIEINTLKDD
jgi:hypothetical protein